MYILFFYRLYFFENRFFLHCIQVKSSFLVEQKSPILLFGCLVTARISADDAHVFARTTGYAQQSTLFWGWRSCSRRDALCCQSKKSTISCRQARSAQNIDIYEYSSTWYVRVHIYVRVRVFQIKSFLASALTADQLGASLVFVSTAPRECCRVHPLGALPLLRASFCPPRSRVRGTHVPVNKHGIF